MKDFSILKEFARGNINPSERPYKRNDSYEKLVRELQASEDRLTALLDDAQKEEFRKYRELSTKENAMGNADQLAHGYRLGALMMLEICTGKDDFMF